VRASFDPEPSATAAVFISGASRKRSFVHCTFLEVADPYDDVLDPWRSASSWQQEFLASASSQPG
jgi:hypothetical protein